MTSVSWRQSRTTFCACFNSSWRVLQDQGARFERVFEDRALKAHEVCRRDVTRFNLTAALLFSRMENEDLLTAIRTLPPAQLTPEAYAML